MRKKSSLPNGEILFKKIKGKTKQEKQRETYRTLMESYGELLEKPKGKRLKAFVVKYLDHSDLNYVCFYTEQMKKNTKIEASKYFRDMLYPTFQKGGCKKEMHRSRYYRVPEFDKYAKTKKIPIPDLMQVLNMKFSCSLCGAYSFSYEDYLNKKCYVIEGDGDINPFTEGIILCYDCYKRVQG